MENKVRLIKAWVDTLSDRQKAVLITSLVIALSEYEKMSIEDVIGTFAPTLEEAK